MIQGRFRSILLIAICATLMPAFAAEAPAWQDEFAATMHAAWKDGEPMPQISRAHAEATLADAYAAQRTFVALALGDEAIGGFKAAIVGVEAQTALGIDGPLFGVLPSSGVLYAKDNVTIDLSADNQRMFETEIGYIFGQGVGEPIPDVAALKKHIKSVAPVLEVPGGASQNEAPVTAPDLVARNINSKAIVVGSRLEPQAVDVDAIEITLTANGQVVNTARGGDAAGGQWETLLKTVNAILANGYKIEAGQIISNGALGKIVGAEPGLYCANYTGFGEICVKVVAEAPAPEAVPAEAPAAAETPAPEAATPAAE
ncbi:MAG: fumarylacetoacetate hydrolase family protein [Candidatus Hydrogenedentes bacterium]|nr:fumarylacetoacetate hydrolase family protein [Candidatus Hydrogenedentota bacterium]